MGFDTEVRPEAAAFFLRPCFRWGEKQRVLYAAKKKKKTFPQPAPPLARPTVRFLRARTIRPFESPTAGNRAPRSAPPSVPRPLKPRGRNPPVVLVAAPSPLSTALPRAPTGPSAVVDRPRGIRPRAPSGERTNAKADFAANEGSATAGRTPLYLAGVGFPLHASAVPRAS